MRVGEEGDRSQQRGESACSVQLSTWKEVKIKLLSLAACCLEIPLFC